MIAAYQREHSRRKHLRRGHGREGREICREIRFFIARDHPTTHLIRKHHLVAVLHVSDELVEETKTFHGERVLAVRGQRGALGQEVVQGIKPGRRFFWDMAKVLRVQLKGGIVFARQ